MQTPMPNDQLTADLYTAYACADIETAALDFFQTPEWFGNLAATCLEPGETPLVLDGGNAVLPMRSRRTRLGPVSGLHARSLSNFYSCRFAPPGIISDAASRTAQTTAQDYGRRLRKEGYGTLRFDALDEADCGALAAGLAHAGWITEPFPQFGNWRLNAAGLSFDRYWDRRPGRLRNTGVRRKRALFRGCCNTTVRHYTKPHEVREAADAYAYVAARSWQKPEPFADFLPGLIRYGLSTAELDVWILCMDGRPAAAQIWVHRSEQATIFKLVFDREFRSQSVGTVLTMCAMESALNRSAFLSIDFGWGDDPYKRDWLPDRRQRFGLAAYNPLTPLGLVAAGRNLGPKIRTRLSYRKPKHQTNGEPVNPFFTRRGKNFG